MPQRPSQFPDAIGRLFTEKTNLYGWMGGVPIVFDHVGHDGTYSLLRRAENGYLQHSSSGERIVADHPQKMLNPRALREAFELVSTLDELGAFLGVCGQFALPIKKQEVLWEDFQAWQRAMRAMRFRKMPLDLPPPLSQGDRERKTKLEALRVAVTDPIKHFLPWTLSHSGLEF